ncbi:hypothetical protein [Brevibacterium litoralis]|uniref:hypothetical protein n=1 Tax=Brevibacterium litoralis TaxID=3138935 RepID=UPI0032EA9F89
MAKIALVENASHDQVMETIRATFESRDYGWEASDASHAVANEDGKPIGVAVLPVSQRLQVEIEVDLAKNRVVLTQNTFGSHTVPRVTACSRCNWARVSARW